jgi:hypothetical protein
VKTQSEDKFLEYSENNKVIVKSYFLMDRNNPDLKEMIRLPFKTILLESKEPNVERLPDLWNESEAQSLTVNEEFRIWLEELNKIMLLKKVLLI